MKKILFCGALLFAVGASAQNVAPKNNVTVITVTSPLRKMFLNLSRPNAEAFFGQSVEFLEPNIRLLGNYAFVYALVQQKGGKVLDSKKLKEPNATDNNYQAIYLKKNGKWTILKEMIGCTDVCWLEWAEDKTIPAAILPMNKK